MICANTMFESWESPRGVLFDGDISCADDSVEDMSSPNRSAIEKNLVLEYWTH